MRGPLLEPSPEAGCRGRGEAGAEVDARLFGVGLLAPVAPRA
ncbi:hypothetical protein ACIHFD_48355 [Nonomuraea sp. NPDC051941]